MAINAYVRFVINADNQDEAEKILADWLPSVTETNHQPVDSWEIVDIKDNN